MTIDPFGFPGSQLLKPLSVKIGGAANKDIFAKPTVGGGGGGRAKKPVPAVNQEPEEDLVPEPPSPPPPKEPPVKLSNPKWLSEVAFFGDSVKVTVDIDLPESHTHLTRVAFTLYRLNDTGKKEKTSSADFHAKDGKVEGEFKLEAPKDLKSTEPVPYIFTAIHRDAKEVESQKLNASEPLRNLICEMDDHSDIKKTGYMLVLKDSRGEIHTCFKASDGVEKDGVLSFDFKNLDADAKYILEMQNEKAEVIDVIFSESRHAELKAAGGTPA